MKRAIYLFLAGLVIILVSVWIGAYFRHTTEGTWMLGAVEFTMFTCVTLGLIISLAIAPNAYLDHELNELKERNQ